MNQAAAGGAPQDARRCAYSRAACEWHVRNQPECVVARAAKQLLADTGELAGARRCNAVQCLDFTKAKRREQRLEGAALAAGWRSKVTRARVQR